MTDEMRHRKNERATLYVVLLTTLTMAVEITAGLLTRSMALLADGIHMGSHVLAIGLSWTAYVFVRRLKKKDDPSVNPEKVLSLSGYTSGLLLLVFALGIAAEAVDRIIQPAIILYREAILVAFIGLGVNLLSAFLLHHDKKEADHNLRAAYLHVLADAVTSIAAIAGLTAGQLWGLAWMDSAGALLGSVVILRWSAGLLRDSGKSLLGMR